MSSHAQILSILSGPLLTLSIIWIEFTRQDSTDNFLLLNNLLNLDDNRKDTLSENYLEGKDWLDLVDFKDETAFYSDPNHPVKDSERKRKHNKSETAAFNDNCVWYGVIKVQENIWNA